MGQIFSVLAFAECSREGVMPPTSLVKAILRFGLCSLVLAEAGWAKKPAPDPLAPTRASLDALQSCLGASDTLKTLRKGLLWGWGKESGPPTLLEKQPAAPPGPEYSESLETDVKACQAAAQIQDEQQKQAALNTIRKDIEIKAADCRKFGMSRKVPVVISTRARREGGERLAGVLQMVVRQPAAAAGNPGRAADKSGERGAAARRVLVPRRKEERGGPARERAPTEIVVGSAQWIPLELAIP